MNETGEEGVAREVKEETGMTVTQAEYLFSLPNIYIYSGFPVHTLDLFFRCTVADTLHFEAMDDAAEGFFLLGCVKIFVIEVKLHGIALGELVGSFSALVIDLDAL